MAINAATLLMSTQMDTSQAERALANLQNKAAGTMNNISQSASGASNTLQQMFGVAGGMAMVNTFNQATNAIRGFAQEGLAAYAFTERLGMSLQNLAGRELIGAGMADSMAELRQMPELMQMSADRAAELQGWMEELAIYSPFKYEDVANAFRLSLAYGFQTEQAKRLTKAMSDFTAGTGQSGYAIHRVSLALGQMSSRQKVASQELNQLSEVGINARQILADAWGVPTGEMMKMIEKGLIPADQAIEAIVSSLERDFGSATTDAAGSISGLMMSLEDLRSFTARDLFSGVFAAMQPYMIKLVETLTDPAVKAQIKAFGVEIGTYFTAGLDAATAAVTRFYDSFIEMGGGLQGVLAGISSAMRIPDWLTNLIAFTASWGILTRVLAGVGIKVVALGGSISALFAAMTGPIGIAAAVITALGTAYVTNFMGIQDAMQPVIRGARALLVAMGAVWGILNGAKIDPEDFYFLNEVFGEGAASQVVQFGNSLRDTFATLAESAKVLFSILSGKNTGAKALGGLSKLIGTDTVARLVAMTRAAREAWIGLTVTIAGAVATISAVLGRAGAAFDKFFSGDAFASLAESASDAAAAVSGAISGMFGGNMTVTEFAAQVGSALTTLANSIMNTLRSPELAELGRSLASALGLDKINLADLRQNIQTFVQNLSTTIQSFDWGGALTTAGTGLTSLRDGIIGMIALIDWGGALNAYGNLWGSLIGGVIALIASIDWGGALLTAGGVFAAFVSAVTSTLSAIDWGAALTAVGSFYTGFVDGVVNAIKTIDWSTGLSAATGWLDGVLTWVVTSITSVNWGTELSVAATFTAGIVAFVASKIAAVDWGAGLAAVTGWMDGLVNWAVAQVTAINWGAQLASAEGWLNSLTGWVTTSISSVNWSAELANAVTFTSGIVDWVTTSITAINWGEKLTNAATSIATLATTVVGFIAGIDWGTALTTYGALWGGLTGGVVSTIGNIDWYTALTTGGELLSGFSSAVVGEVAKIDWAAAIAAYGSFFAGFTSAVLAQLNTVDWASGTAQASNFATTFMDSANKMRDDALASLTTAISGFDLTTALTTMLDNMTTAVTDFDWTVVGTGIGTALGVALSPEGLAVAFAGIGALVAPALTAAIAGIVWVADSENFSGLVDSIKTSIDDIDWTKVNASFEKLKTAIGNALGAMGEGFKTAWEGSAAMLAWKEYITPLSWDEWVDSLEWPLQIGEFDWDTWLDSLSWPEATFSFDWSTFVPHLTWPTIPEFPGWSAFMDFFGGGGQEVKEKQASGTDFFKGGLTWVGEKGPEIVNLPRGTRVFNNRDSVRLMEAMAEVSKLPMNAEGTTSAQPIIASMKQSGQSKGGRGYTGDIAKGITRAADAAFTEIGNAWPVQSDRFFEEGTASFTDAASETEKAFTKTAKAVEGELKGMLGQVPGLMGVSSVTADQMKMAELGIPQNFADDWLRHLTDEVINGVDWADADIGDAAKRAGLDPNMPKEMILEMVKQMWADSSLFANPENLDLINMRAVGDSIAKQQAAAAGQANIMAMFGLGQGDKAALQAQQAADGIISNIAAALQSGQVTQLGTDTMAQLATGMGQVTPETTTALTTAMSAQLATVGEVGQQQIADTIVGAVGDSFAGAIGGSGAVDGFMTALKGEFDTQESKSYLSDVGGKIAEYVFEGYKKAAREMPWADAVPPAGNAGGTAPGGTGGAQTGATGEPVGNNAGGTSFWRGGLTWVGEQGPELVRLPRGSRVWSNGDSMDLASGNGVTIENVNIQNGMDLAKFEYRLRQIERRRRGR